VEFNFENKINNFLKIILKNAQEQNLRVFFVGGIVRDKILNIPTFDIDLLIESNAIDFSKTLPSEIKIKSIHEEFCTVKLEYDNIQVDIASSRSEKYPYSGCLPVVSEIGIKIEKDVLRRDFSINSIYCELKLKNDEIFYNIIDLVNGTSDIKEKTLKVLHDKSYIDDPTRILRGLGFKYRFNFDFSKNDKELINNYLKNIQYENMSHDRILKVFKKTLNSSFQKEIFKEIIDKKIYKLLNQNDLTIDFSLIDKIFDYFTLDMLSMSEFYTKIILNSKIDIFNASNLLDIYKYFSKMNLINLAYYFYKTGDKNALTYETIKNIKLNISGDDLISLGYKQGLIIGKILDNLLLEKLNNPKNFPSKNEELAWVLSKFPQK